MTNNNSFSTPIEYMLASTFSGRVVFTSESLISYVGYDLTGRNLNEIFSDDVSARILYNCSKSNCFKDNVTFSGMSVALRAHVEADEILIFVNAEPKNSSESIPVQPTNKISKELDSSISVLSMMLESVADRDESNVDPEAYALMCKQLMKLNRLSKNITAYTLNLSKSDYVNYQKHSVNDFVKSTVDKVRALTDDLPVNFSVSLPKEEIYAMFDAEKLRRAFLNALTNSIASRGKRLDISITLYPLVSDNINIVIRDNGCGFTPASASNTDDAASIAKIYNSFGLAVSHIFLELHGGHFSVISEVDKGTVVNMTFPQNMDKSPPGFSSMIPPYAGSADEILLELSPILPPHRFMLK